MTIAQIQIANTDTDLYTSVDNSAITSMVFCNTTASTATVTIYIIPDGSTSGDSTTIIKDLSISAKDTYVFDTSKFILSDSDKVTAVSDTNNAITATISYVGI